MMLFIHLLNAVRNAVPGTDHSNQVLTDHSW
jgi:hypothetical protein